MHALVAHFTEKTFGLNLGEIRIKNEPGLIVG